MTNRRELADRLEEGGCCTLLLSEGLDLCVRARRLDSQQRPNDLVEHSPRINLDRFATRSAHTDPDRPYMTKSATIPIWVQDQYERDLADWERRARHHLAQGCTHARYEEELKGGEG